jgi:hypothetical protein
VAQQKPVEMQPINYRQSAAPDVAVRLVGSFAKLRVTAWDRDSISLTGEMPYGADLSGLVSGEPLRIQRTKLNFSGTPDAHTPPAGTLELRVPIRARVQIRGGTADVSVTGVGGELDLNVVGGSVHVAGSPHILKVDAMDASVTVDGSPEWARLGSAAGDITMTGSSPDAHFITVSGNIRVSDGVYERTLFESVDGNIVFAGDIARGASFTFDTHSGNVELALSAKASVHIDAASYTGTIENGLTKLAPSKGREDRGQEIVTDVGSGSGRAIIRTFKGVVRLTRR